MSACRLTSVSHKLAAPLLLGLLLEPSAIHAEVVGIEIDHREPVAGGRAFGLVGSYEKLEGSVRLTLDPNAPGNARVVDLQRAPRADGGRVHVEADVYALQPTDPARGNGTVLLEVPNRGGKAAVRYFNRGATRTFDPTTVEDFGDGFSMRHGFTIDHCPR